MAHPGLLSWANSIRHTMVNHQCRQQFEDQIQSHGFLFLDDYMDNILAQAKRDPLIDLVKTPGRKKAAPKKTRAAVTAAKAKSAIISLEDTEDETKEIELPANRFQKALLQAKDDDGALVPQLTRPQPTEQPAIKPSSSKESNMVSIAEDADWAEERTVEDILSSPPPPRAASLPTDVQVLAPPQPEIVMDLSIIAEDDEIMERSVRLVRTESETVNIPIDSTPLPASDTAFEREEEQDGMQSMDITTSSSGQTFHSIALNSPEARRSIRPNSASEYDTAPLPQLPASRTVPAHSEAMTAPLPTVPASASTPNIEDTTTKGSPPTHFPSLPAPSPLRKSMRAPKREPSLNFGMPVPPLPVGAGKRTSWLMKAREVKAMEVPGTRASTIAPATGVSGGSKRKSGDMLASTVPGMAGMLGQGEEERRRKVAKTSEGDAAASKEKLQSVPETKDKLPEPVLPQRQPTPTAPSPVQDVYVAVNTEDNTLSLPIAVAASEGVVDRFKRAAEGLGVGPGKNMGKSLGGPAAAAVLAAARADRVAAHARLAERDGLSDAADVVVEETRTVVTMTKTELSKAAPAKLAKERKLSVSDLVSAFEDTGTDKTKEEAKSFKPVRSSALRQNVADESTSTTPPHSPPPTQNSSFVLPPGPVFNKQPVFVPPAPAVPTVKAPSTAFSLPAASSLGVPARLPSPSSHRLVPAVSAQSTVGSIFSDQIFDSQPKDMGYTTEFTSQEEGTRRMDDLDEDDSWPMDEKLANANSGWPTFGFAKEDSMTWSTLPTESQRDTRSTQNHTGNTGELREELTRALVEVESDNVDDDLMLDEDELRESDLEDIIAAGKSTVSLVKGKTVERSQSQMSMASTSDSSQSQTGWVGQATKLVSSVLGGGKKPLVPSLQRAAAAAKKEKEEKDKKVARLRDVEARRQLALQKKAEEEKAKAQDDEKKRKDEGEKRKREREETTDKRPVKTATKKEEDPSKKRKITVEVEKKPVESKKPSSKDVAPSRMPQPTAAPTAASVPKPTAPLKSGFKPSASNQILASSAAFNALQSGATSAKPGDQKPTKPSAAVAASSLKGKGKAKMPEDDIAQPSLQLKDQMAARAKVQLQAAKQLPESTEDIELPDVNSEYSDSEDEDRPGKFEPPNWAQSPELRAQLERQSRTNPDDIFGPVKPLRMEEVFRTRQSRFRARTSSANWTGTDKLTVEEEREYVRRMGYRS